MPEGGARYVFHLAPAKSDFTALYVRTKPELWDGTAEVFVPAEDGSNATAWKSVGKTSMSQSTDEKNARWDRDHQGQHLIGGIPAGATDFAIELRTAGTSRPTLSEATLENNPPQIVFQRPQDTRLRLVYGAPGITKATPSRELEVANVYVEAGPRPLQVAVLETEKGGGSWTSGPLPKWVVPAALCALGGLLILPAVYYMVRRRRDG
jgi:hypothetical protein